MPSFLNRDGQDLLTPREREILQLLADGMSNGDVAAKLFISQETVKSHVRHILAKLEADTRTHAVAIASASRSSTSRNVGAADTQRPLSRNAAVRPQP